MFDEKYPEVDPNKKSALQIWEERYSKNGYLYGKEPVVTLKTFCGNLKTGKALDIAMGEGRNAVYLASNGFEVEGIDVSPKAVEKAKALATEKGVNFSSKVQNLDFFLMPLMKYDTILMTYYKPNSRFFSEIRRGLVAGGTFLLEAHSTEQVRNNPNSGIDFESCYKPNEVLGYLQDFLVLYYKEMAEGGQHLVQLIAQKKKN